MDKSFSQTLTLSDAMRLTGPRSFNLMVKPAGSLCNLDCRYCYYLDKSFLYGGREPLMDEETLETLIRSYIRSNETPEVTFHWHGGEPLVAGKDFYRKVLELERRYADGKTIHNTIQTNGTLLDREWTDILLEGDFLVGVSLDGPASVHDRFRRDKGGAPTFEAVLRGVSLLRQTGVPFNTLTTVNSASEGHGTEVYRFLKAIGSRYMQFLPVVEHVKYPSGVSHKRARPHIVPPSEPGARLAEWSVSAAGFGRFLCDVFDEWLRGDVGRVFVTNFESALACWCSLPPTTCIFASTCGGNAVVEHNGDVYVCDHFVYPQYRLGNIKTDPLAAMMDAPLQVGFGIGKRNRLPGKCLRCKYLFACHGECPKHRFGVTESGETGLNALCAGYIQFFSHIAPTMEKMKALLVAGR